MRRLPLAAHTYPYLWTHTLDQALTHLGELGQTHVEALVNPPHLWPETLDRDARRRLTKVQESSGVRVVSLNCPSMDLNLTSPDDAVRRYSVGHYRETIGLAADLGAPWVTVIPGRLHPLLSAPADLVRRWMRDSLAELAQEARGTGVTVLIENLPGGFVPGARDMIDFLDTEGLDGIDVVYDVANAQFADEDPRDGIRTLGSRMRLIHLSDTGSVRYGHDNIGTGDVPFADLPSVLDEVGYDGMSVLEVVTRRPEDADADLARNIDRLVELGWSRPDRRERTGA